MSCTAGRAAGLAACGIASTLLLTALLVNFEVVELRRSQHLHSALRGGTALVTRALGAQSAPTSCADFLVKTGEFPTLESIMATKGQMGHDGGEWTVCTHLRIYGMNFMPFYARALAFGIKPKTVLEFGCGLGTTSDFLARFTPGGSRVTCVEPQAMLAEVFDRRPWPHGPQQLAMNIFEASAAKCASDLSAAKHDLVLTLEVLEHIPKELHARATQFLADATGRVLVFSAARPKQGGTGHLDESMVTREEWAARFAERGLVYSERISDALRRAAFPDREYDLGYNTIVMLRPEVDEDALYEKMHAQRFLFGDNRYYPWRAMGRAAVGEGEIKDGVWKKWGKSFYEGCLNADNEAAASRGPCKKQRRIEVRGAELALWPELDLLRRQVVVENLCG